MKTILLCLFILFTTYSSAQKTYDCTIVPINGKRVEGALKAITDSTIQVGSQSFNWQEIKVVRIRKHKGFERTMVPLSIIAAVAFGGFIATQQGSIYTPENGFALGLFVGFGAAIEAAIPIYFIFRNKCFRIKNYEDFRQLKSASVKYLTKK